LSALSTSGHQARLGLPAAIAVARAVRGSNSGSERLQTGPGIYLLDYVESERIPEGWSTSGDVTALRSSLVRPPGIRYRIRFRKPAAETQSWATVPFDAPTGRYVVKWDVQAPDMSAARLSLLDENDVELAHVTLDRLMITFGTNGTDATQEGHYSNQWNRVFLDVLPDGTVAASSGGDAVADYARLGPALPFAGKVAKIRISTAGTMPGASYTQALLCFEPKIVAIGDSLTFGHIEDMAPYSTWDFTNDIAYQASMRLNPPSFVMNRGIGGMTSAELRKRFETDVLVLDPKVVIIECGVAAIIRGEHADTIIENVRAVLDAARKAGIRIVLCEATPASVFQDADPGNADKHAYNAWVRAQEGQGVSVAHTHDAFAFRPDGNVGKPWYYTDGIHHTKAGTALFGRLVAAAVMGTEQGQNLARRVHRPH